MRYTYACFKNYIGFYNGMGLEKVEIDFTKCKNNIILISGINGCGRSTLMNALNIFPDSSSSFIPEKDGEKLLTIFDNGDIYSIKIISPVDSKGGRKQTKAYITKNGLELNSNGNISSYKEIVFSEFELDSNYISLSKLSGDERGLGDKTPAERKKFASNIIANLETYNNIYKTLNKKSLIFKSHINTLHTKIQNIGMKDNLEITLSSLKQKSSNIQNRIMELNNIIVSIKAKSTIDKDKMDLINKLNSDYLNAVEELNEVKTSINVLINKIKINEDDIEKKYNDDNLLYEKYNSQLSNYTLLWKEKSSQLSEKNNSITSLEVEIESLDSEIDKQLEDKFIESNNKINKINSELKSLNIDSNIDLIFSINNIINLYNEFIDYLDNLYSYASEDMLKFICLEFDNSILSKINDNINSENIKLESIKNKIKETKDNIKELELLKNKPNKCNNSSCLFISKALKIQKEYSNINIEEYLNSLLVDFNNTNSNIKELKKSYEKYSEWINEKNRLDIIINKLMSNKNELLLLNDTLMSNINKVLINISNMNPFNSQRDPARLRNGYNLLNLLRSEKEINTSLSYEYKLYKDKYNLLNSTISKLEKTKEEQNNLIHEVSELKKSIDSTKELLNSLSLKLSDEMKLISLHKDKLNIEKEKNNFEDQLDYYKKESMKDMEQFNKINEYENEINNLNKENAPILSDIQNISGQLTILNSYYAEYEEYKTKYNMIETLKKYCSPTGGGIQTIFMQLYMSKVIELSNQVLQMLFGGEYKLLDFIINQNEFRIPFIGSGLPVDDISSGSTSQICIMGMVINLVLLYQASTKFNIARLDEIDGGLDTRNRFEFVNTLHKALPILNIEQLFIISHSIEADTSSVDIIKLKSYSDFEDTVQLGNIIYDYSKEIEKTFI